MPQIMQPHFTISKPEGSVLAMDNNTDSSKLGQELYLEVSDDDVKVSAIGCLDDTDSKAAALSRDAVKGLHTFLGDWLADADKRDRLREAKARLAEAEAAAKAARLEVQALDPEYIPF